MIKRTTAIVFILLANIILLAHAVVPHHHHHKQVCLVSSHCIHDEPESGQNTNRDNHSHDNDKNSDNCILKEPVIVLTNQWKGDFKFNNNASDQTSLDEFNDDSSNCRTDFIFHAFLHFGSNHFNNSAYSFLVSASLGLRAPPAV